MKYCLNSTVNKKSLNKADEINIKSLYMGGEVEFIDKNIIKRYKNKRFNFSLLTTDPEPLNFIKGIKKDFPELDIAICLDNGFIHESDLLKELRQNNIKYYFFTPAKDWDSLYGLISLGVSDVFVTEEMGFSLAAIHTITAAAGVQIRCFPNVAQSSWREGNSFKKFFIRPEDVKIYEPYVDVLEFFGAGNREETYFNIYQKQEWFGDLSEIIIGLDKKVDNRCIVDFFGDRRTKCEKRCLKGKPCNICDRCAELADNLHNHAIVIQHNK